MTASKIKQNSITTAKIAQGAVTGEKIAPGSVDVTKLAPGFVAPAAEKLNHSANISVGGTVLAGSLGIAQANVTHTSTGFYCFSGLSPAPVGGVATVDYSEAGEDVTIQLDTGQPPALSVRPEHRLSSIQQSRQTRRCRFLCDSLLELKAGIGEAGPKPGFPNAFR